MQKYGNKIKVKPYENSGFGVKPRKLSQKRMEAKAYVERQKMSNEQVKQKNEKINRFIEKYGVDFTKKQINGMID